MHKAREASQPTIYPGQALGLSPLSCSANRSDAESLSRIDCISNAGGCDGARCTSRDVILGKFYEHTWHLCRFLFSPHTRGWVLKNKAEFTALHFLLSILFQARGGYRLGTLTLTSQNPKGNPSCFPRRRGAPNQCCLTGACRPNNFHAVSWCTYRAIQA